MNKKSGKPNNGKWIQAIFALNLAITNSSVYSSWQREFINLLEATQIVMVILFNSPVLAWPADSRRIGSLFYYLFDVE
jgi:hypothetical protein